MTESSKSEFNKLAQCYLEARRYIDYAHIAATSDKDDPQVMWLNKPTLSRWLFGAAKGFFSDYRLSVKEYLINNPEDLDFFAGTTSDISEEIEKFRCAIREKFPNDELLMRAVK